MAHSGGKMKELRFKKHKFPKGKKHKSKKPSKHSHSSPSPHRHSHLDEGWEPPPQSFKPTSLHSEDTQDPFYDHWDDDSTAQADYWQSEYASTSYNQPTPSAPQQTYDEWADGISAAMWEKTYGAQKRRREEAEAERERGRKKAREQVEREAREYEERKRKVEGKKLEVLRGEWAQAWVKLKSATPNGTLRKKDVSLPFVEKHSKSESITASEVEKFLLNGVGPEAKKKVLKEAMLLYHPDKFAIHKPKFKASEWDSITTLVSEIAGVLNTINAAIR
ncbi:hypothetical protein HK097_008694 [Rhizophlyctis rosea]|uniref:J domain-containing protein n=1 Tax=Rhizophlyctis rosea TaxID=64517 RepID=A0AAD5X3S7_9FUNG|nr:hypothetical protein HK097_008694 [Rhizophlyctis rosea]